MEELEEIVDYAPFQEPEEIRRVPLRRIQEAAVPIVVLISDVKAVNMTNQQMLELMAMMANNLVHRPVSRC